MITNQQARREAKQLFRICQVNGLLDEDRVRQVTQYAVAAGYRACTPILEHFLRLLRLDRTQHTAKIESAAPLPDEMKAAIQADLTRRYGRGLTTAFTEQPSLIGGMRIQVSSDVYDGSVLGRLEALEKSF
jgi:F-type H+-transporting ATPase subunit delta